ncbi:MAG: threonylcarbamoyl-AMP synthase [DPANN group archaeon]|nr:threonylcarbamoyl-AMP synthase [DPANN group archaeon]
MLILKIDKNNPDKEILKLASDIIKSKGLVIYPTDTAYAIGADLLNSEAIDNLDISKQRQKEKNYTAIVCDIEMAKRFAHLSNQEIKVIKTLMPGPLTLAVPKNEIIPNKIHKSEFTFRIPDSIISKEISRLSNTAITATSANISGENTPYSIDKINPLLKDKIDLILDAGVLKKTKTSTICKINDLKVIILREGAISKEDIIKTISD